MRHEGKNREDFLFFAPSMAMIYVLNFYNLISMAMTVSFVWSDVWSYSRFVFLSLLNSEEIVGLVWYGWLVITVSFLVSIVAINL